MSATFRCDACGKQEPADRDYLGRPTKPRLWYVRTPIGQHEIHACNRECMTSIDREQGYDPYDLARTAAAVTEGD